MNDKEIIAKSLWDKIKNAIGCNILSSIKNICFISLDITIVALKEKEEENYLLIEFYEEIKLEINEIFKKEINNNK